MRVPMILSTAAIATVALGAATATAGAHTLAPHHHAPKRHHHGSVHSRSAVFVQTDDTTANAVAVYARAADGRLSSQHLYATGGKGGVLGGSEVDHLASQGSLQYDASAHRLFAVNAGSNTITSFAVDGTTLKHRQVISSGGDFPVSLTVHGDVLYVLNALDGGTVSGYHITNTGLSAIAGSTRALGLNASATPQFTTTPGQVSFTPNGKQLLVTTKANTNAVEVFGVAAGGALSSTPTTTTLAGQVPFAVAFTAAGDVAISEAGSNSVADFTLSASGSLTQISSAATGAMATCWLTADGSELFAGNAGSASESTVTEGSGDQLTLSGSTATDAGTVDASTADHGRFLYIQTGAAGIVDEYLVTSNGGLQRLGAVNVPNAVGGEGIATS
jgi:6-phosphogluconolactonase (cycloisomerase 2 family)